MVIDAVKPTSQSIRYLVHCLRRLLVCFCSSLPKIKQYATPSRGNKVFPIEMDMCSRSLACQAEVCPAQIAATLSSLGLFHMREDVTSGYAVDLSIPRDRVAIEADGPSHMARNDGSRVLGHTAMKRRHLTKLGWKVCSYLPFSPSPPESEFTLLRVRVFRSLFFCCFANLQPSRCNHSCVQRVVWVENHSSDHPRGASSSLHLSLILAAAPVPVPLASGSYGVARPAQDEKKEMKGGCVPAS